MFTERFYQAAREKQVHFFGNVVDIDLFGWYEFNRLLYNNPKELTVWNDQNKRVQLQQLENRSSSPAFSKKIHSNLKSIFYENYVSLIAFAGFDNDHKSFKVHRDLMDVLYVQVLGSIEWSIWDSSTQHDEFLPESGIGKQVWKQTMIPGDAIWIPRGTFHHVHPLSGRVGFSYGIEKLPDPASYI